MLNKRKGFWIGLALGIVSMAAVAHYVYWSGFSPDGTTCLYVDADDDVDSICRKLTAEARPQNIRVFRLHAHLLRLSEHLHTGRYEIADGMTALTLVRNIRNHTQVPVRLIVPATRTLDDMAARLARQLMADSATIARYLAEDEHIAALGFTHATLPSLFIPNTYEVYWDTSAEALFSRMKREYDAFWTDSRLACLGEVGRYAGEEMTREKVATLASIVDSETANNGEKPSIAALYLNRLRKGMLLQSDPTVIYALHDFTIRRVLNEHLKVESPYNTYRYKGLPPGPIRVPSIAGIDAVLHHATNDYLYMCAKEDFSGTHNFAVSYAEHQQNAARYVRALNARGIR